MSTRIVSNQLQLFIESSSSFFVWLGRMSEGTYPIPLAGIGSLKVNPYHLVGAIQKGFRLIDTAKAYQNEKMVGDAIAESGILDVFVITKLSGPNVKDREVMRSAIADSIRQLGKIPELFLIHDPYPEVCMLSLFDELERMKKEGGIKEWGVSNFDLEHLLFLMRHGVKPVLNQVEYHPYFQRPELLQFCKTNGIILQAYRPLASGRVLSDHTVRFIAKEHGVGAACIVYAWLKTLGLPIVTRVSSEEHQIEYAKSGECQLSAQEMHALSSLNQGEKGRTCKKGGWLVPFTSEVQNNWRWERRARM